MSGGMMTRIACGITINLKIGILCKPTAFAASIWPLFIANIPERTFSAIKVAVYIDKARSNATSSGVSLMPPLKLNPFNAGCSKYIGELFRKKTINTGIIKTANDI